MICGNTVRDKVRNEEIRERTEVESIEEHLREQRLRWFSHMERMDREMPQSVAMNFKIDCSREGRLKQGRRQKIFQGEQRKKDQKIAKKGGKITLLSLYYICTMFENPGPPAPPTDAHGPKKRWKEVI